MPSDAVHVQVGTWLDACARAQETALCAGGAWPVGEVARFLYTES